MTEGILDDDRAAALPGRPSGRAPKRRRRTASPDAATCPMPMARSIAATACCWTRAQGGEPQIGLAAFLLDPLLRVIATCPLERIGDMVGAAAPAAAAEPACGAGDAGPGAAAAAGVRAGALPAPGGALWDAGRRGQRLSWSSGTARPSASSTTNRSGAPIAMIEDVNLQAAIRARIIRRLVPEIRKAFQFDGDPDRALHHRLLRKRRPAGISAAHRDNTTPGTAHRRFAVTINLNDDFEGGELWFPEFGRRRYRPPAGGAVVFSCSLLHEATPVTQGTRYAVLPFLYDDAAARIREAEPGRRTRRRPRTAYARGPRRAGATPRRLTGDHRGTPRHDHPTRAGHAAIIGFGLMGCDIAAIFLAGGWRVTAVEPTAQAGRPGSTGSRCRCRPARRRGAAGGCAGPGRLAGGCRLRRCRRGDRGGAGAARDEARGLRRARPAGAGRRADRQQCLGLPHHRHRRKAARPGRGWRTCISSCRRIWCRGSRW